MIVPDYWAEARKQHRDRDRQITVRRFGWSNDSPEQAQALAEKRAEEALAKALAGKSILRREPKVPYNGAEGVPIREEVLARHGDEVITRNAYGARCLNTPDVLIGDVDFEGEDRSLQRVTWFLLLMLAGAAIGWSLNHLGIGLLAGVAAGIAGLFLAKVFRQWRTSMAGGHESVATKKVRSFLANHPSWNIRLYRTPAGLRVFATHALFKPADEAVQAFFAHIDADPMYRKMCLKQHCFRARLSAKPWRIGIETHMKPRPGVWPVHPERLPERNRWLQHYEQKAANYAACQFIGAFGSGTVHPKVEAVITLHDQETRAHVDGLAIA